MEGEGCVGTESVAPTFFFFLSFPWPPSPSFHSIMDYGWGWVARSPLCRTPSFFKLTYGRNPHTYLSPIALSLLPLPLLPHFLLSHLSVSYFLFRPPEFLSFPKQLDSTSLFLLLSFASNFTTTARPTTPTTLTYHQPVLPIISSCPLHSSAPEESYSRFDSDFDFPQTS